MEPDTQRDSDEERAGNNQTLLRIELGGGSNPIGGGFLNLDVVDGPGVDHVVDLNGFLPFGDNSVKQVYSSHCIEHVENVYRLLNEICRVCVNRARVTITAPHFGQEMAMRPGHVGVFSEMMVTHFDEFPECWTGEKRLVMIDKAYRPTKHFDEARNLWPALSDEQIYRFIQNTCHDVTFRFKVARIAK